MKLNGLNTVSILGPENYDREINCRVRINMMLLLLSFVEASTNAISLSGGTLAGIIVGSVCGVAAIVLLIFFLRSYHNKRTTSIPRYNDETEGFENRSYDIDHTDANESSNGMSMRTISESNG